tara:strand:- start:90 stop:317 length:228 start_codon:yes stop_codon:yes gene_type:complete
MLKKKIYIYSIMNWFNAEQWVAMLVYCSLTFFLFPKIAASNFDVKNADIIGMILGFVISIMFWLGIGRDWAGRLE